LHREHGRALFQDYELSVGSTGNLGLSIGIAGAALGFQVAVHMSVEAKEWKKERLRQRGVKVVEHATDYTAACVVARAAAAGDPRRHFIDDENSEELFLGYACAVPGLKRQLADAGIVVDREHPLFIHLPCGVGGGPGGIAFAARHVFGDAAHSFFVEPTQAPCMLLGMLSGRHSDISVYSLGLGLKTDADGLAVSTPSRFIGQLMEPILSGCCTLDDCTLYRLLLDMYETEGLEVEPSAAAGCAVPALLGTSDAGRDFLLRHGLTVCLPHATHVIWTTGGLFVPPEQHEQFRRLARPCSYTVSHYPLEQATSCSSAFMARPLSMERCASSHPPAIESALPPATIAAAAFRQTISRAGPFCPASTDRAIAAFSSGEPPFSSAGSANSSMNRSGSNS